MLLSLWQSTMNPFSCSAQIQAQQWLQQCTFSEKVILLAGRDDWHIGGIERLGIPRMRMSDCGHGVTMTGGDAPGSTCFPTAIGMAATWNPDLLENMGKALGEEALALGNGLLLGPMINLHRIPTNGRNFECYSEDPVLTAKLASATIKGLQSTGVGACAKAAAANNIQTHQEKLDIRVSPTVLRELYMKAFRLILEEAQPYSVMTAYNSVNGEPCSENTDIIQNILRTEMAYEGMVVSDWRSVRSTKATALGLDLEMPGPAKSLTEAKVVMAINEGRLTQKHIDDAVFHICCLLAQVQENMAKRNHAPSLNTLEHRNLARHIAEESIVLLKNERETLPLMPQKIKRLAIIGPSAKVARLGGGGSASLTPPYTVSPYEGLMEILPSELEVLFCEGAPMNGGYPAIPTHVLQTQAGQAGVWAEYYDSEDFSGPLKNQAVVPEINYSWGWAAPCKGMQRNDWSVRYTTTLIAPCDHAQCTLSLSWSEGQARLWVNEQALIDTIGDEDRDNFEAKFKGGQQSVQLELRKNQSYEIKVEYRKRGTRAGVRLEWIDPMGASPLQEAVRLASRCEAVLIFTGLSNLIEGGNMDRKNMDLPSNQDTLIAEVARVNANTTVVLQNGSPVTMPWLEHVGAVVEAFYPGQEGGRAIANILTGKVNPSGRCPITFAHRREDLPGCHDQPLSGQVEYLEGTAIGYRYLKNRQIPALFPFGFGLSYSSIKLLRAEKSQHSENHLVFKVWLENKSDRDGHEVVQIYARHLERVGLQHDFELAGFSKVLCPAFKVTEAFVEVKISHLSTWDETRKSFVVPEHPVQFLWGTDCCKLQELASPLSLGHKTQH